MRSGQFRHLAFHDSEHLSHGEVNTACEFSLVINAEPLVKNRHYVGLKDL